MKTLIIFLISIFYINSFCQIPDYKLKAENFQSNSPYEIKFDINLLHIEDGYQFIYVGGQWVLTATTNFPEDMEVELLNSIGNENEEISIEDNRLIITCHVQSPLTISKIEPGTRMVTIKLSSKTSQIPLNLRWVNVEDLGRRTIISAYDVWHDEILDICTSFCNFVYNNLLSINNELTIINSVNLLNYPNPFNSSTVFSYELKNSGQVNIVIYNTLGQKVDQIVNQFQNIGNYKYNYNSPLNSGIYYYTMVLNNEIISKNKFTIIK